MRLADLPLNPTMKTLRQFAVLWVVCFGVFAAWRLSPLFACVAIVGVFGIVWPKLAKPVFVGWTVAVFPIAWVVSHTLLAIVYFGLFTPLASVFWLIGRDALQRRTCPACESFWIERAEVTDMSRYLRQF